MRSAIGIVFYRTSNAGPCLWRAGSVRSNRWSRIRRNPFVRSDTLENQIAPTKTCPYLAPLFLDLLCAVHVVLIHVCTCVAASGLRGGGDNADSKGGGAISPPSVACPVGVRW